jgi:hypothetical protein
MKSAAAPVFDILPIARTLVAIFDEFCQFSAKNWRFS